MLFFLLYFIALKTMGLAPRVSILDSIEKIGVYYELTTLNSPALSLRLYSFTSLAITLLSR
jgi:hypothetical protein